MASNPDPTILLTRPILQSNEYAAVLRRDLPDRFWIVISPLLEIRQVKQTLNLEGVHNLIFTSVNGIEAFARESSRRDFACYCVGDRTAECDKSLGFSAISADGTVENLAALLVRRTLSGPCLHVHGRHVAQETARLFQSLGAEYRNVVLYDQHSITFTSEAKGLIKKGNPLIVPLFSPRSAALFAAQVSDMPLDHVVAICISQNVANELAGSNIGRVIVAVLPRADAVTQEIAAII